MPAAVSVARELVSLSHAGDEPDPLTPLRLQKLLYYTQGWSLAVRAACLFPEKVLASRHGPTVRQVRHARPAGGVIGKEAFAEAPPLADEQAAFVRAVWQTYREFSASRLSEMARDEAPWRAARAGRPADDPGGELTADALADHFARQLVPAALAAHAEYRRQQDREARAELAAMPSLNFDAFRAAVPKPKAAIRGARR